MSIRINDEKCVGCGRCVTVCPGTLIYMNGTSGAYIKYPDLCWGCVSCVKECNTGAIEYFLGADIGGMGASLNVRHTKGLLRWTIKKLDGETVTVDVDPKDANRY